MREVHHLVLWVADHASRVCHAKVNQRWIGLDFTPGIACVAGEGCEPDVALPMPALVGPYIHVESPVAELGHLALRGARSQEGAAVPRDAVVVAEEGLGVVVHWACAAAELPHAADNAAARVRDACCQGQAVEAARLWHGCHAAPRQSVVVAGHVEDLAIARLSRTNVAEQEDPAAGGILQCPWGSHGLLNTCGHDELHRFPSHAVVCASPQNQVGHGIIVA
mmetsp:Transcript_39602/g.114281  ORF Transcript_39602/g.114281 Transcript_39602/m.114281 type:complete len:222 (+) Transcript_39602:451-1116(+)